MKKKLLAIVTMPFYAPKGSSLRVFSVMEKLSSEYDIDIICYPHGEDIQIEGVRLYRVSSLFKPRLGVSTVSLSRFILDVKVFVAALIRMLFTRYDVVHCEDFEAASLGSVLSILNRKPKYVYDLHNSIVDNLEIAGKSKLFLKIAGIIEKFVVSRFDQVIINWKMYMDHPVIGKKNNFLYYDHTDITSEDIKLPISGKYWAYSGNYKEYQGIKEFIDSYAKANVNTSLVLVGNITDEIVEQIESLSLLNKVYIMGSLPLKQSNYVLSNSELCLIPRTYGRQPGLKAIHHIMMGKVTLGMDIPANTDILTNNVDSVLYKSQEELVEILKRLDKGEIDLGMFKEGIEKKQKEINKVWSEEYFIKNYLKDE